MFQRFVFWSSAVFLIVAGAWGAGVRPARALAQGAESTIDKAILDAMRWRSIGPLRGGRSIAVSGVKGRPKEGYFGAVGGGLWKTIDGGLSWTPVTDGQITTSSVGAVAVSESNPDIVFIASYATGSVGLVRVVNELGYKPRMFGGAMIGLQFTPIKAQLGSLLNGVVINENYVPEKTMSFPGVED